MTERETGDAGPSKSDDPAAAIAESLTAVRDHLHRLELMVRPEVSALSTAERRLGDLGRLATEGEHRLPVSGAVALAIALQLVLPSQLAIHPVWLFPAVEGVLMVVLIAANPVRINRSSAPLRTASVALIALISLANAWSSAVLINELVTGTNAANHATLLLSRGASVYGTNIIVFALWYWEMDRGGPVARNTGTPAYPDFLFPQMTQSGLAAPSWIPNFVDYFYVSFTNAVAFSPTDTMPLTRWAKMLMLMQSAVALLTVAFVIARAVNILK